MKKEILMLLFFACFMVLFASYILTSEFLTFIILLFRDTDNLRSSFLNIRREAISKHFTDEMYKPLVKYNFINSNLSCFLEMDSNFDTPEQALYYIRNYPTGVSKTFVFPAYNLCEEYSILSWSIFLTFSLMAIVGVFLIRTIFHYNKRMNEYTSINDDSRLQMA